jgi:epoxyqueuosine reductase
LPRIYFPATYSGTYKVFQDRVPGNCGIFSMRHAAVRAGLGEFGLNNVVVTPRYGPRVRFNALVTEAELEPTPLPAEQICRGH